MAKNIYIASNVNVDPCFLLSDLNSHLSYTNFEVRVKSQNPEQIYVLGSYGHVVVQYGHLLTSGLALH